MNEKSNDYSSLITCSCSYKVQHRLFYDHHDHHQEEHNVLIEWIVVLVDLNDQSIIIQSYFQIESNDIDRIPIHPIGLFLMKANLAFNCRIIKYQ